MAEKSKISWTHHTFNIAWGCVKISPGCTNCYADAFSRRVGHSPTGSKGAIWGAKAQRRTFGDSHWQEPLKWNRRAAEADARERVFCSSMTDVFLDDVTIDPERAKLWPLIRETPNLDWLLLTKRADRIASNLPSDWGDGYDNVWLGVSIESNDYVERAERLRKIPAAVRFISYEPALGPLDRLDLTDIDWIIYGGESGHHRRPENKQWARDMRDRCRESGVAFFHKQSANLYTERGVELDGHIIHEYPSPRKAGSSKDWSRSRKPK